MIQFFRKIRQRLLTENKFSKYLLYAIGEIVLVVIGILIALQINNLNEEKKSQKQLDNFLVLMLDELAKDKEFFEKGLARIDTNSRFLSAISEGHYTDVSIELFPKIIGNSMANKNFGITYNNIKADGKFNLIANIELKKVLLAYYEEYISKYNEWANWHQKYVTENIEGYIMMNLPVEVGYKTDPDLLIAAFEKGEHLSIVNYQLTFLIDFRPQLLKNLDLIKKLKVLIETELS